MGRLGSLFNKIIKARESIVLISHEDASAITVSIDSHTHNIPIVFGILNYLERVQNLIADQYMSKRLLDAFLVNVNFEDVRNRKDFKKFARKLLSSRYREINMKYLVIRICLYCIILQVIIIIVRLLMDKNDIF